MHYVRTRSRLCSARVLSTASYSVGREVVPFVLDRETKAEQTKRNRAAYDYYPNFGENVSTVVETRAQTDI